MISLIDYLCPRCANGQPTCADRKPNGTFYDHAKTCVTYKWAKTLCQVCQSEIDEAMADWEAGL